ncbi:MAG: hypothetical protein KKA07_01440 [Bacteroidetes bacterium]|nr:hypothetical protein [Bacteroidota bacterium]MBU1717713.1 hypothetical protein [Bacteroidota bacterium]
MKYTIIIALFLTTISGYSQEKTTDATTDATTGATPCYYDSIPMAEMLEVIRISEEAHVLSTVLTSTKYDTPSPISTGTC